MSTPWPTSGSRPGPRRRRRFPLWLAALIFFGIPLLEIYVIIQVGQAIGPWWTILLLIADSLLGGWLIRREGAKAWRGLSEALSSGRMPAKEIADGMLILAGGLLMLSPGFVLDLVGILMILPLTRPIGRRLLTGFVTTRLAGGVIGGFGPGGPRGGPAGQSGQPRPPGSGPRGNSPRSGEVVEGEVVDPPE